MDEEPDLAGQLSIDEAKEPDRIKKAVLQGLIEKNVNLSDLELGELLGFKTSSIEEVRKAVRRSQRDKKGEKCHSWDYVLAFDVGDDELIEPPSELKEAATENGDTHEDWVNGMKRSKYFGQIINEIWGRLENKKEIGGIEILSPGLKVDGFRSREWPTETAADGDGVDRSEVTYFLVVGITENALKWWADKRDTDLLIDPEGAIKLGRKRGFPLAVNTAMNEEEAAEINDAGEARYPLSMLLWDYMYGEYNQAADPTVYKHYPRKKGNDELMTVFDEKTRLRIIYECMISDQNAGGAEIKIEDWIKNKKHPLKAVFALHDADQQQNFVDNWIKNWKVSSLMQAPLEDIRNYFGEPVAFYFGFLMFYLRWLVAPAAVGLIFFVWQMATLAEGEYTIAVSGIPIMGLFMIFWCVAFVDFWLRQEARYRHQWGMTKFEDKAVARPQFEGEWTINSVTGLRDEEYSFVHRGCKQTCVYWGITIFMGGCVTLVLLVLMERDADPNAIDVKVGLGIANSVMIIVFDAIYKKLSEYGNNWENHKTDQDYQNNMIAKSFVFRFVNSFASLFYLAFIRPWTGKYAFYIKYYDDVCDGAADYMSNMFTNYNDGLTNGTLATTYDFDEYADTSCFANCAADPDDCLDTCDAVAHKGDEGSAIWELIYEGYNIVANSSAQAESACEYGYSSSSSTADNVYECTKLCSFDDMLSDRNQVILFELQIQLITLFLTAIVIQNTLEVGVPFLKEYIAKKKEEKENGGMVQEKSEAEIQMDKDRYANTIDDMSEMVVQFGYVTLFVMCFPLIPLLAIINNIFELKVDATNLVMSSQRPDPNGSYGLGTWNSVLSLFSILSVATNALLITSRTNLLNDLIGSDGETVKLYFFCGLSVFLSVVVAIEKWVIPDVPDAVEKAEERQRNVEDYLIKGSALDDADDDEVDVAEEPEEDKDVDEWPFNPHLESLDVNEAMNKVPIKLSGLDPGQMGV